MCEGTPHLDYRHTIANCNLTTMVANKVFKINILDYFPCLPNLPCLRTLTADYHGDKHAILHEGNGSHSNGC